MKKRLLGKDGFSVSEVGLGTWQLGSDWGIDFSEEQAFALLSEAVVQGVTFFDTADVYGSGKSESLIGAFLRQTDRTIYVGTKVGRLNMYPDGYTESAVRKAIENSLNRLKVTSLDLVQLHCVPTQILKEGAIFNWLRKCQEEGIIKHFGASVESVEEARICMEQEGLLSLQVIFNIFRQKLISDLFPEAKQKGVGIIVRLPLASGLLAGKYTKDTTFKSNDHRNYNKDGAAFNVGETFAGLPFHKGVELVDGLKPLVPGNMSMAQWAQRWCLDHPAVSTIITGARTIDQVRQNTAVAMLDSLTKESHDHLQNYYNTQVKDAIRGPY